MLTPNQGPNKFLRAVSVLGMVVAVSALLVAGLLMWLERYSARPVFRQPREAFIEGSIGTELMPLPVMQVLPELVRDRKHFLPLGDEGGDWIEQFGFLRRSDEHAKDLPMGFTLSPYRPRTGAGSPVQFVGLACATCHTSEIIRPDRSRYLVIGTGNTALNLFAWLDAVQAAILDQRDDGQYVVTVDAISSAYERTRHAKLGIADTMMIGVWLDGFRKSLQANLPRFDDPYGHGQSLDPNITPTGPSRTQPFRTLVRNVLMRPGSQMNVFTKIAPVYHEDWQEWAQVDGGIRGLKYRSALAVLAAGATLENMQVPEIEHNIIAASDFVRNLAGPRYSDVFPDERIDEAAVKRGREIYVEHCDRCHGRPGENGTWIKGSRQGGIVPVEEIGTDSERVTFRHSQELSEKLFQYFPEGHPFKFPRDDVRAPRGYLNKPMDSAFSRAPYLHNASVLTLAELINLKPRQSTFYRGRNVYDPAAVGLRSSKSRDKTHYFEFDTAVKGNSNLGHDYPWPYKKVGWNEDDLKNLLEFLKTL